MFDECERTDMQTDDPLVHRREWSSAAALHGCSQRLGGAIEELQRIVDHFDDDSRRSGYDRQGALALMGRNSEQLVRDQGTRMSETIDRLANLRAQQIAMNQRGVFARVTTLATGADREIAARTWRDFEFACRFRSTRSCSLCSASSRRWHSRRQWQSASDASTKHDGLRHE